MPELPEVETVRKGLEQLVVGKTIEKVEVRWPKIIEMPEVPLFQVLLEGQTIKEVHRRGKFLIFKLTDHDLISHLRMEGKYEFFPAATTKEEDVELGDTSLLAAESNAALRLTEEQLKKAKLDHDLEKKRELFPITKHTHVLFTFTDHSQLQYRDVRKFGRMALVAKDSADQYKGIRQLGPEPRPEVFTFENFQTGLLRSKKAIKPLLLDQRLVTGLGNIYVDEALWQAKIHPEQPADTLTDKEIQQLRTAIIDVLERAVLAGGTTIRTYLNALGEAGKFQLSLNVYGQTAKPCPRCGSPIIKIKVAQRGTHLCPHCQKLQRRQPRQPQNRRGKEEK